MKIPPETRYALSGEVSIAYQAFGAGDQTLIIALGAYSHIEVIWEFPAAAEVFQALGRFARVILFDKRGVGLSDRVSGVPTLEERMDDIRAVMRAENVEQTAILGISEGGAMSVLFAATYPDQVTALILFGSFCRWLSSPDVPGFLQSEPHHRAVINAIIRAWGSGADMGRFCPSLEENPGARDWWARYQRMSVSPGAMKQLMEMNRQIDVDSVLPGVRVPTLVLHRRDDQIVKIEAGRHLVKRIPGARFVELNGGDHTLMGESSDLLVGEIEEFLTGSRHAVEHDRILATVMLVDIVDSTATAAELGDQAWGAKLEAFQRLVRDAVEHFRGQEIDTAGDGYFASFDGPARAIHAARRIRERVGNLGLEVRVGLHTGECERINGKIGGIAVHIGARVSAIAGSGEILVSGTVKDLVIGSDVEFAARGIHQLKGVPGEWPLYAVVSPVGQ